MEVKINKEIRNYTESIILGLSFRQCLFSIIGCVVAVILYFAFIDKLGTEMTSWICILGVVPFALLGFVKYQEMNAEKIVKVAGRSFLLSKRQLIYKPINVYYELLKPMIDTQRKESISKNDKKFPEIKKIKQR